MKSQKTCLNCKFNCLCEPVHDIDNWLNKIRSTTINAWLASDNGAAIYNSYECTDSEKVFDDRSHETLVFLASGCKLYKRDQDNV